MIFFYLLISVMPLVRHPLWSEIVGDLTLVKYVGAATLICAGFHLVISASRPRFFETWQARWFVIFAAWAMVSYAVLGKPIEFEISPFLSYISFVILFFVTHILVDSRRRLRMVLLVAIGSVAYASAHVMREWQKYGDFAAGYRAGWISGDPNYFSLSALLCLPFAYALLRTPQPTWERWFCLAGVGLTLLGLTAAASRGGFLGLVAAVLVIAGRARRKGLVLMVAGVALLPLMLVSPSSPLSRLVAPDIHDQQSADTRTALWKAGIRMVQAHPLTGIGVGNFKTMVGNFGGPDDELENIAHNTFVEIAAEMGVPGLALYLAILVAAFRRTGQVWRQASERGMEVVRAASEGVQTGLVAFAVAGMFVSAEYQKLFWLVMFLSMCLPRFIRGRNASTVCGSTAQ